MIRRPSIGLLLLLVLPGSLTAQEGKRQLTVEDIYESQRLQISTLHQPRWMEGGRKFSYLETDTASGLAGLCVYTVADGSRRELVAGSSLKAGGGQFVISTYEWSADGERILFVGSVPGHGFGTRYGVFTLSTGGFRLLGDSSAQLSCAKFSPDGSRIGYVRSHNICVVDLQTGMETPLTSDGTDDLLNGSFDWVYGEEFDVNDGWRWSPDGRKIAFWQIDQSPEPRFPLTWYSEDQSHPRIEETRYPAAGDPNARVKVGVVDLATRQTTWMDLGANTDIYIPRILWTRAHDVLCIERLNRAQDTLNLLLANDSTGAVRTVMTETDTGWIDILDDLTFLTRSPQFLWTSRRSGFEHIFLFDNDGALLRQLTRGEWDVTKLVGVDEKRKLVYFIGTQASPLERQLYRVRFDGTGLRRVTQEPGCHEVDMSPDGLVFLDTYSRFGVPTEVTLRSNEGESVAKIVENPLPALREYALGERQFFTVKTPDGTLLNGWMITPPGFSQAVRYPVLMYVYGGPGSQTVLDSWGGNTYLWHQMIAGRGYIVVSVDNRGTGGRGKAFMEQTHLRLGLRETRDQIESARYLAGLPFVDAARIGIWGWSFGGYMTCMAMTLGADVFKTGVAVAPVTDWRYYDTIYTERYMETPARNPEGYRETSPVTYAALLRGKLLILHGTTDDNVHWQNTMVFVDALIRDNKQVQTMFYPGRNHGIYGENATRHLRTMVLAYLTENL